MSKTVKIVNIAVFCVWISLISLLLYRNYAGTSIEKTEALKGSIDKATYWYDIYAGAKKIGFASTTVEKVGDEILIRHERELKVRKAGNETILFENFKCLCDPYYSIKSFEYVHHFKDEKELKVTAEVDSGDILFFLESPEKRRTFKTPTKGKDFYVPITFVPMIVRRNPAANSAFTIPMLDMGKLSIDEVKVVLEEIRPLKLGIGVTSLYKMRAGNAVWWSNEKGIIVKEESPAGMTLYSQTETIARDPSDRTLFDYTLTPFFKSNRILPNAESLKMLKVRIKGFPMDLHLYASSLVTLKDDALMIRKEDPDEIKKRSFGLPCKESGLDRYLRADEWVLSEEKTVKGNAMNMAAVEKHDAFRLARYLNSDLFFSVKATPFFVLPDSMDIFRSHLGDHIERTIMFASFARSTGLPTRLVGGLVYRDGYFYFHTWPEVWFGGWIPTDPTLAQFPADVTHIPLREGTVKEITSFLNELTSFDIEVLEAS
jgi:hypothetical protein